MDHTSINQIIIDIMVVFMVIGGIDRIAGNRLKLGEQFEEGFHAFGSLALGMTGFVCLAPVLADLLAPLVAPFYQAVGADPAMFAGTLLALDMGGYPIAQEMAQSVEAEQLSGIILGSMMGVTLVFTIPASLTMVEKEDHELLATGILYGIVTIPAGCFVGGVAAGFGLVFLLRNLIPVMIVAGLIAAGLIIIPSKMIKGFCIFGKFMIALGTAGIVIAIVEALTGLVLVPGMTPVSEGISIVGSIVIILAGAYPMVAVITKVFATPLHWIGRKMGINEKAAAGLIASMANSVPMLGFAKEMDPAGKVINFAFMVSGAFVFGDHLGFTSGVDKAMVFPMICGKLTGGILAVVLAMFMLRRRKWSLLMPEGYSPTVRQHVSARDLNSNT